MTVSAHELRVPHNTDAEAASPSLLDPACSLREIAHNPANYTAIVTSVATMHDKVYTALLGGSVELEKPKESGTTTADIMYILGKADPGIIANAFARFGALASVYGMRFNSPSAVACAENHHQKANEYATVALQEYYSESTYPNPQDDPKVLSMQSMRTQNARRAAEGAAMRGDEVGYKRWLNEVSEENGRPHYWQDYGDIRESWQSNWQRMRTDPPPLNSKGSAPLAANELEKWRIPRYVELFTIPDGLRGDALSLEEGQDSVHGRHHEAWLIRAMRMTELTEQLFEEQVLLCSDPEAAIAKAMQQEAFFDGS